MIAGADAISLGHLAGKESRMCQLLTGAMTWRNAQGQGEVRLYGTRQRRLVGTCSQQLRAGIRADKLSESGRLHRHRQCCTHPDCHLMASLSLQSVNDEQYAVHCQPASVTQPCRHYAHHARCINFYVAVCCDARGTPVFLTAAMATRYPNL